jgi:hypothetical protein
MKNYFRFSLLLILSFIFILAAISQNNPRLRSSGYQNNSAYEISDSLPYLGQTPPDTIPEIFGPGFISTNNGDEYSICFSQDGKEIYFSRSTPNVSNTIWWTHFINGAWTVPVIPPFTENYYNSEPFITYDNQKMYFVSVRDGVNNYQIWHMTRNGSSWTTPQKLTAPFSIDSIKMFPTLSLNGNLYFTQFDASYKGYFYIARNNNGIFETPVKLSTTVNAFYNHGHAFIAPDESYIVFDAIPTQQSTGSVIYVCFKSADSTWGTPVKLSNTINSTNNQILPYISPDGKYLFFAKQANIWWVDSKVVTRHKPVGINESGKTIPKNFELFQNYPNPFNPSTSIRYDLLKNGFVKLVIFDALGRELETLVNHKQTSGTYEAKFNASRYPSGVYFCKLTTGKLTQAKKMILIK